MTKQFIADASRSIAIMLVATHCICAQELSPSLVSTKPESGHFVKCDDGYMVEHSFQIPGTDIQFDLVPIPPLNRDRQPFWIGKHEVTFREFREFQRLYLAFRKLPRAEVDQDSNRIDAVTAPSQIYDPSRFDGVKTLDYPAFSMTQYAAKQYTKWLSLIAETPFRLPMESEWMHAASAGVQQSRGPRIPLEAYANFDQHRDSVIPVGQLRPNSWGLYDMQGNVMEWVITKLAPRRSAIALDSSIDSSVDYGEKGIEQWIAKGGHFASTAEDCEISRRTKASLELWEEDPMLPHSTHWLCNFGESSRIGFRIVRSYGDLQKEKMQRYWEPVSEGYARRVAISLSSGYSVQGAVTPELPDQIREAGIPQPQDWNIPR